MNLSIIVIEKAQKLQKIYPNWRKGQCLYNALNITAPYRAEKIIGTDIDPFYDDSKIPIFLEYLKNPTKKESSV